MRIVAVLALFAVLLGAPAVIASPVLDSGTQGSSALNDIDSGFCVDQSPDSQTLDQLGNGYDYNDRKAMQTYSCVWVYVGGKWQYICW